jgi:hypothetical protein
MSGDDRVRHCTLCDLNVYNFANMKRDEILELLARSEGRVCARLYRRADGTLLTSDCPSALRALRDRMSRLRAALMAALVGAAAFASGCATTGPARSRKQASTAQLDVKRAAAAEGAVLEGTIVTEDGGPLPGVSINLRDESGKREFSVIADAKGAFALTSLPDSAYRLEVTLSGLLPLVLEHVPLKAGEVTRAHVIMRTAAATETMIVGQIIIPGPFDKNTSTTTTFTQEWLRKVPMND